MLKYIVRKLLLGYKASSEDYINKIKMGGGYSRKKRYDFFTE